MTPHLAGTPVIETARLHLRAPVAADWPVFAEFILSDRARFVRPAEFDRGKAWRAFGHLLGHWVMCGFGQFVVTDRASGAALGAVGAWFPEGWPERELGWTMWRPEAEGRGIAFEAARAVLGQIFGPWGWDTAVSYIDAANARSIALAERLGATRDAAAAAPGSEANILVYRHPGPEAA